VVVFHPFARFMHIRKVHSAYKCRPWKAALSPATGVQRETSRPSRHFSRYGPPLWPHLYIYMAGASYLYVDISRPSEMLPRIIKLAKYFRATTVITQAPRSFCSPSPRRLDARSQPVRQFAMKRERERERERERAQVLAKYEHVFVSRARMLMNASISCREWHCYAAVDRAMSKRDEVNPEDHPRQSTRIGTNESHFRTFEF